MKDIKQFEKKYAITKDGRVWSYPKYTLKSGCWRKSGFDKNGYLIIPLWKENKQYIRKIHRLVAEAFIPNPKNKPQVNHKNGIKNDNRIENLEWVTNKQNHEHAMKNGLYINIIGEKHYKAKLTENNVKEIKKHPEITQKTFAERFGVNRWQIYAIRHGITWKHIT